MKLLTNLNNVGSKHRKDPVRIRLIILILIIAVADIVMIADIPYFIKNLQIGGKNRGPEHTLSHDQKELDHLHGLAKDRMTRKKEADEVLDRSRQHDHLHEK